jgi:hypothetical protein
MDFDLDLDLDKFATSSALHATHTNVRVPQASLDQHLEPPCTLWCTSQTQPTNQQLNSTQNCRPTGIENPNLNYFADWAFSVAAAAPRPTHSLVSSPFPVELLTRHAAVVHAVAPPTPLHRADLTVWATHTHSQQVDPLWDQWALGTSVSRRPSRGRRRQGVHSHHATTQPTSCGSVKTNPRRGFYSGASVN